MNPQADPQASFLSWQGQVTGPHTQREIQTLLKLGKIHSLYRIQADGEWILLRDHLADLDQQSREAQRRQVERKAPPVSKPFEPAAVPAAIVVPDENPAGFILAPITQNGSPADDGTEDDEPRGIAYISFALSLLFFVPFLNGITWLLSLIFGHLALPQSDAGRRSRPATLAWIGLWLSYVEISFFLLGLTWFAIIGFPNMIMGFFILHGQMLGTGVGALIGAGVLMLAVKLTSGRLVPFPVCFVGALLPSALCALGTLMVQTSVSPDELAKTTGLVLIGTVNLLLFLVQMFFWAGHILLPDEGKLGLGRAALVSVIYTVIFIFVGIGYAILFARLMG